METKAPTRPKPNITEDMQPFWDAVNRRRFVLMRCQKCGAWYWPAAYCRFHANEPFFGTMRWEEASGCGTVFAFNIHRRAFHPALEVPYVIALIELQEGPMFGSNIIDCDPENVKIGMPVQVTFSDVGDKIILPLFKPSARAP
jgi:uncharacterized OB-fold protein